MQPVGTSKMSMMKRIQNLALVGVALTAGIHLLSATSHAQDPVKADKVDGPKLKTTLEGLGYELIELSKEVGKEKFQFTVKDGGLDIPIGAEISPSTEYLWLTVNVGPAKPTTNYADLIKKNGEIQPVFFYETKTGTLLLGLANENRAMTPAVLKKKIQLIVDKTVASKDLWLK